MNNISVNLMGGLGNQLFQIFAALSYTMKNDKTLIIPDFLKYGIRRETYWHNFLKEIRHFTFSDDSLHKYKIYKEIDFSFKPLPNFNENTMIEGYFQSYKYFENEYELIIKLIQLRRKQREIKIQHSKLVVNKNAISLHFRLGDYKSQQEYHPILPIEYYENAIRHILSVRLNCKILYFCQKEDDEVVESKVDYLRSKFPLQFVKVHDVIADWKRILIMSCCRDNIISNGTFSWWSAYFNENPDKIVCYPDIWFGPSLNHDTKDLFPDSWEKISCQKSIPN